MVAFFKEQKKVKESKAFEVGCHELDLHGRGVARENGKVYFIEGLMPEEKARVILKNFKGKTAEAAITKITHLSDKRRESDCEYLSQCGGCPLQHLPEDMALEAKISGIKKVIKRSCNLELPEVLSVATSDAHAYRRACRFSVKTDHKKLKLGFRGSKSHDLIAIDSCLTLTDRINSAIDDVKKLINKLECKKRVGHVEFLDSDGSLGILVRINAKVTDADRDLLSAFGEGRGFTLAVAETLEHEVDQSQYIKESVLVNEDSLYIKAKDCIIDCTPSSFVQVNRDINEALIDAVIEGCALNAESKVLDMFCGLGNFTLPIAKRAHSVVGVDIVRDMIEKAKANALKNNLDNVSFVNTDLEDKFENQIFAKQNYDVVVMDPGRSGAKRATVFCARMKPKRIVLISCNVLAASRDIVELLKVGYKIESWSVFDMFPRTTHIETMFVFSL